MKAESQKLTLKGWYRDVLHFDDISESTAFGLDVRPNLK